MRFLCGSQRVFTKQGYLLKRGRKVCSWKRRYFCIYGGVLYYYYTAEIANPFQPLGVITLQHTDPSKSTPLSCSVWSMTAHRIHGLLGMGLSMALLCQSPPF